MHASTETTVAPISVHFLADHRRLDDLFSRLLEAFADNDREQISVLWNEFDVGLTAHLDAEEKCLIPALLRTSERDARLIIQEHKHIRTRLTELGAGVDLHLVRLDDARSFIDELRAHAKHEDAVLYRVGDAALDAAERTSLFMGLAEAVKESLSKRTSAA